MSLSRPMGMNSDVLKMKVEKASPITGSQPFIPVFILSFTGVVSIFVIVFGKNGCKYIPIF